MRLSEHSNKLETNAQVESQNFGIGDASVVIEILRNRLYEHKVRTLVQEYICNARDAMREVGKGDQAFDVTIPNRLNPVFKVRDFGPGISPDRMRDVFVMYGASTKRGTNNQTGGFGIGAKSAWSYTDSFTIVTFVNGVKRAYVAHTGVNNNGRLDLVSTEPTDEPNGTEIQVAVKFYDIEEFVRSVYRAVYFWEVRPNFKGTLEPFGVTRGQFLGDLELIHGSALPEYVANQYSDEPIAVIDGVPYPIARSLGDKVEMSTLTSLAHQKCLFHIPNGVLEVSASRESIADSKTTVEALKKIVKAHVTLIKKHIRQKFDAVKTASEYLKTYHEMVDEFCVDEFAKFADYEIKNRRICSDLFKKVKVTRASAFARGGTFSEKKVWKTSFADGKGTSISLDEFPHLFVMLGQDSIVKQNKRIREYSREVMVGRGQGASLIIFEPLNGDAATLDQIKSDLGAKDFLSLPVPVVEKEKKEKVKREDKEFCVHSMNGDRYQYLTLAGNTDKWLYVPVVEGALQGFTTAGLRGLNYYLRDTFADVKVCGLADRSLKMVAGDSNFQPLADWLKAYAPTDLEIALYISSKRKNEESISRIKEMKNIKDPFLNEMIRAYSANSKLLKGAKVCDLPDIVSDIVAKDPKVVEFELKDKQLKSRLDKQYPLINYIGYCWDTEVKKELEFYMNSRYLENRREERKNG